MADRRRKTTIGDLNISRGGYTPFQRIAQSALASAPETFDYSELDKKYPMRQVTPMVPSYIQQEMDEDRIAQKEGLATQRIREAQASIYESQLNEQIAQAEQVPLAREYFSTLNPQSADWPEQRDTGFSQFPLIEGSAFAKSRIASMDRLYDNWAKKNIGASAMTLDEYGKAVKEIGDIERAAKELGEEPSDAQKKYMGYRAAQIRQFESQQGGVKGDNELGMPRSMQAPNGAMSFSSVEEADSSGLPAGTIVYINGRKARID